MNRLDYQMLLDDIMKELSAPRGTFQDMFGKKSEEELKEIRFIAAVALSAADRYYARLTKMDFALRERDEHPLEK
ncbi:MAG: hypothetical protein E7662_01575 [Ruminococcaceae bacterium]|nr:hypothetical protein [Oscillospiraceae bacterium]